MGRGHSKKRQLHDDCIKVPDSPDNDPLVVKKQKREEDRRDGELPRKKFYRQRAHANPFSDHALTYPSHPQLMDWTKHYPAFKEEEEKSDEGSTPYKNVPSVTNIIKKVEIADIGCGFGGLLFALAPKLSDTLILGMEIRSSVAEYVQNKIHALRRQQACLQTQSSSSAAPDHNPEAQSSETPVLGQYNNVSVLRANSMKFLPNFFSRSQLKAIYLCFPDPHFKHRKHKARIVSSTLNSEYAYVLRPNGLIYTITDVQDLHEWMCAHFQEHELFERLEEANLSEEETVGWYVMHTETEEGKKVERHNGIKFAAVWRRKQDPVWDGEGPVDTYHKGSFELSGI